jgi:RHS repeat-associated protein
VSRRFDGAVSSSSAVEGAWPLVCPGSSSPSVSSSARCFHRPPPRPSSAFSQRPSQDGLNADIRSSVAGAINLVVGKDNVISTGTGFVDHSWGTGGPAGLSDDFSARFTRTVTFAAGTYRFTVVTDDGSRLWIDDQPKIAAWWDQSATHTVDVELPAGGHTLRYEYYEHTGGATARLTWELRSPIVLASGESLGENQTRVSLDGAYRLQYQGDGNLVVMRLADDSCAWSSQTNGTSVGAAVMQGDGNLVIYNGDWTGIWSTGTWGADGASLQIANDELAIVAPGGTHVWTVSLLASQPGAAATEARSGASMSPRGPLGGASAEKPGAVSAVSPLIIALLTFCGLVLWRVRDRRGRRLPAVRPFDRFRVAASKGNGRLPHGRPELRRRTATAVLLTALLLVPATALAQTTTQVVEFYTTDAIGSVRAVTKQVNGEWTVVNRHDFMPFGEEVAPPSPPSDKRLFTGKERDSETGMDYFGARYYWPNVGRFTTVDPELNIKDTLVDPQRWNKYAYAWNSPLRYVDPDGRWPASGHSRLTVDATADKRFTGMDVYTIRMADLGVDSGDTALRPEWHGMPGSADKARVIASSQMDKAVALELGGDHKGAMKELGRGLHVVQDIPAHEKRGSWSGHAMGLVVLNSPDSRSANPAEFKRAQRASQAYIDDFLRRVKSPTKEDPSKR